MNEDHMKEVHQEAMQNLKEHLEDRLTKLIVKSKITTHLSADEWLEMCQLIKARQ